MTKDELEQAFTAAQDRWLAANPNTGYSLADHRYFFWSGSEFGIAAVKQLYNETYTVPDEVEGAPV